MALPGPCSVQPSCCPPLIHSPLPEKVSGGTLHPAMTDTPLQIAGRQFTSRLMVGTGKFPSNESMKEALEASGAQIVTVALRRADLTGSHDPFSSIPPPIFWISLIRKNTSFSPTPAERLRQKKPYAWRAWRQQPGCPTGSSWRFTRTPNT